MCDVYVCVWCVCNVYVCVMCICLCIMCECVVQRGCIYVYSHRPEEVIEYSSLSLSTFFSSRYGFSVDLKTVFLRYPVSQHYPVSSCLLLRVRVTVVCKVITQSPPIPVSCFSGWGDSLCRERSCLTSMWHWDLSFSPHA